MREALRHIYFAQPLYFLLLSLLPLLWLRLGGRSAILVFWRSAIVCLLVLALADPERVGEVTRASEPSERVFAFDLSRSIPESMRLWMVETAKQKLAARDRAMVFAGEAREVKDWDRWVSGKVAREGIRPDETNLENLFSSLLRPPQAPRTVFLFTDGWETSGAAERLLSSLALSGTKVFPLLPPNSPPVDNVAVRKIIAPHQGTKGEAIRLKVVVENQNSREVSGSLALTLNGHPFRNEAIRLSPGSHIFTFQAPLPDGPMASLQATFVPSVARADLFSQDNQTTSWVGVRSKERVLLLNGQSGEGRYLEEILKRRGYEVTSPVPGGSPPPPAGYGIVIFNNVGREKFSAEYLAEIERHVASGNAFLMLGGEASFAPGGYRETAIEPLLPVELREPKKPEEKHRALVLVIDKSGSMNQENRVLYAKEAAKAAAGQLKERDLLGVVGFDVESFVVVPLSPMEKIRATVGAQIDRLKAGGQTYLLPALEEAMRQLEKQSASRKHVIILSDGVTRGAHSEYTNLVTFMKEKLRITTSAVAIGEEVDLPLLKRIAQYGGGFFHHTYDPATLPQIVLKELQDKPEPVPIVESDFTPVAVKGSELLAEFPAVPYPPLKGFIETELKKRAQIDLALSKEERRYPLLASWNYGRGKAVAFATDLSGRWSKDWVQWELLERFWGKVFDWLRPVKEKESLPPHEVRINLQGAQPVLELYLYAAVDGNSLFRYSFRGHGSRGEGTLMRVAPGHYQTELPLSARGDYRIELFEERQGQTIAYPPLGYSLSFNPKSEIPRDRFNIALLAQIARSTGGAINPEGDEKPGSREVTRTSIALRPPLIFLVLILFLSEVILRRFFFRDFR